MTQWADAGLEPNEAAIQDHLLMGLLQDGAPIPGDHIQRLAQCGIHFGGNWFGLISLQVVAVDAYAYIQGLGHTSYSEAQLAVNILELLREELAAGRAPMYLRPRARYYVSSAAPIPTPFRIAWRRPPKSL